jgi:anti-anti-sigma factor
MRYEQSSFNQWWVLKLNGRLDSFVQDQVTRLVDHGISMGKSQIVLDLKEVVFVGLPLIKWFANKNQELRNSGGELVILNANALVSRHLVTYNAHNTLKLCRNFDELRAFATQVQISRSFQFQELVTDLHEPLQAS